MSYKPKFWCGIDIAKETFDAALVSNQERKDFVSIPVRQFEHSAKGIAEFLAWSNTHLQKLKLRLNQVHYILEATGRYSLLFYVELSKQLKEPFVSIVNPYYTSCFQKSFSIRSKTDALDARALGLYGRERKPEPYTPTSPEHLKLKRLVRQRTYLVGEAVAHKNRLKEEEIDSPVYKIEVKLLQAINEAIKECETEIKKLLNQHHDIARDAKLLMSIPGVALLTAATILAELGDLRRFTRAAELSSFAGLAPSPHESGKSIKRPARISKAGNGQVRQSLYMASLHWAKNRDQGLGIFYQRLVDSGKAKKSALLAVSRKILVMMRAIIISGKPYDPFSGMKKIELIPSENVPKKMGKMRMEPRF